ncbi:MAG: hypothetical protein HWE10_09655 [Gammaproteobacteria bacterium]|nr:hypothetical protein [Gammaproteobacteria bacterium]
MDFSALNKNAAKSFNQQKSLIKRVLAGKKTQCPTCTTLLTVTPTDEGLALRCENLCTDISLDAQAIN